MDTFVEQIVAIKKTTKTWMAYIGIALVAIFFMTLIFYIPYTRGMFIVFDALIIFGVFKLYSIFNIEYEYIITNSTMDIDKIIAKSSRKRAVSIELSNVQRIEKFNGVLPQEISKICFFACDVKSPNSYVLFYKEEGKELKAFVFEPNDRVISAMKNYLPRHISENF